MTTVRKFELRLIKMSLVIILGSSLFLSTHVPYGNASPASNYSYKFIVDREGFTDVEINFSSTDRASSSWVFVPKFSDWHYTVTSGQITQTNEVETDEVTSTDYYFYEAFVFSYQTNAFFNMTIEFAFANGALIIEPRGIFYSPQIGFQSNSNGKAEVFFHESLNVTQDRSHALAIGATGNSLEATELQPNRASFVLSESIARIQVEFNIGSATPDYLDLKSNDSKTFTFKTPARYQTYAITVLDLFEQNYENFTRLFNVTLENVAVQWFLPDFETLLAVGGFVPFTGEQLGEININIFFTRAVNGTVEIIATHELVHRFMGKAGLSPGTFLWFHEGMAQYTSLLFAEEMGYEEAVRERHNLDQSADQLIATTFGDIGFIQQWSPFTQPSELTAYYVASYYVVSELADRHGELAFYQRFFQLIYGSNVQNIDLLAFHLSKAANASVALTLRRWGFSVTDLYNSPQSIDQTAKTIEATNPYFQPYRWLAEFLFNQALISFESGNTERANSLLRLSTSVAEAAPWLTILTIATVLALLGFLLSRRKRKPELVVPQPPSSPDILYPPI